MLYALILLVAALCLIHIDFTHSSKSNTIQIHQGASEQNTKEENTTTQNNDNKHTVKINTDSSQPLLETSIIHQINEQPSDTDTDSENITSAHLQDELSKESMTMHSFSAKQQKEYLVAIQTASSLISNFLQHKNYIDDISILQKNTVPKNVEMVIEEMLSYSRLYITDDIVGTNIKLFPSEGFASDILGHFISIHKMPKNNVQREEAYRIISNKLYMLNEYFFSDQFFNQILHND